jgi:hypothetical protein
MLIKRTKEDIEQTYLLHSHQVSQELKDRLEGKSPNKAIAYVSEDEETGLLLGLIYEDIIICI